tara:strand:+ start:4969 stop:5121 length:153 start_codon:yes stop_codon:yes gene_type:complete
MEIVFWVMVGMFILTIGSMICLTSEHNKDRPKGFYEISQQKQWKDREMDK